MLYINKKEYKVEHYPSGEMKLNLKEEDIKFNKSGSMRDNVRIDWHWNNDVELLTLMFITQYLHDTYHKDIYLNLLFCPYARMDRVKTTDEIFTLKYFTSIINSLHFTKVYIVDPHSDVCMALIDNVLDVSDITRDSYIQDLYDSFRIDYLCFPDNGCAKRLSHLKMPSIVGYKNRDWKTGKINSLNIIGNDDIYKCNILIVDDICSKGGTFYHTAKALKGRGARNIYLYVTHCENSILNGEFPIYEQDGKFGNLLECGLVDMVYTTDTICTIEHPKIKKVLL